MRRLWTCPMLATVLMAVLSLSASATVTITSADRFVSVFPVDGAETKSQSSATSGQFINDVDFALAPGEGNNDGSLYADQDSTISGLTVFGFGRVELNGSNPEPPGFGGTAESSLTLHILLSQSTSYSIIGVLNELEEGGSVFARATLLDSLLTPVFDFATTTDESVVPVLHNGLLSAGAYTLQVNAFGVGSQDKDFNQLAGFDFNFELEEQHVVPEPASVAVWGLIGVTFCGVRCWRRRAVGS